MDVCMKEKHEVEQHTAGFEQFGYDLVLDKAHSIPKQQSDKVFSVQVSFVEMMDEGKKALRWSERVKNGSSVPFKGILAVSLFPANCHNPCSSLQYICIALNKDAQMVGF